MNWVFDLCGTLFRENTTFAFMDHLEGPQGLACRYVRARKLPPLRLINKVLFLMHWDVLRILSARSLRGRSRDELQASASRMLPFLTPVAQVQALLKACQERGDQVLIASAAFDFIVAAAAERLGVEHYRCTQLAYDQTGRCLGTITEDHLGNKHHHLQDWIQKPFTLITDNVDDTHLVRLAEKAYILTPVSRLSYWQKFPNATVLDVWD